MFWNVQAESSDQHPSDNINEQVFLKENFGQHFQEIESAQNHNEMENSFSSFLQYIDLCFISMVPEKTVYHYYYYYY